MEVDVDPFIVPGINFEESVDSSSIIRFTPISGARQEVAPSCYLLEIDQCKILLDCGCLYDFDMSHMESLRKLAKSINIVIISHADIKHLGSLPYLFDNLGCSCPILVTVPVHHFGMFVLNDAVESYRNTFGKELDSEYKFANIEKLFDQMIMLRYSQPFIVQSGPAKGISLTAFPAGHSIGGSIWKIKKNNEDIIYAINFNHRREAHLDGASFETMISQSTTVLIGDAKSALNVPVLRKNRDQSLIDDTLSTLKQGGNVLIPIDAVCRALEIIQILNQKWMELKLSFSIVFLSYNSRKIIEIARGLIEWMGVAMMKSFEQFKENPFECKYIKSCHSLEEVEDVRDPKVILATTEFLDCGFSKSILIKLASSSKNLIIHPGFDLSSTCLLKKILNINGKQEKIKIEIKERVPLDEKELVAHNKKLQEERENAAAESAFALHKKRIDEEAMEEFEEELDESLKLKTDPLLIEIDSANKLREIYWNDYKQDCLMDYTKPPYKHLSFDHEFFPLSMDKDSPITSILSLKEGERLESEELSSIEDSRLSMNLYKPWNYQMFPYKERRLRRDAYGSYFDHLILQRPLESTIGNEVPSMTLNNQSLSSSPSISNRNFNGINTAIGLTVSGNDHVSHNYSDNMNHRENGGFSPLLLPPPPTKWIGNVREVTVKCSRKSIDFRGLIDGRSLKTIYQGISPRHLILVGGSEDATEFLVNHFKFLLNNNSSLPLSQGKSDRSLNFDVYAPKLDQNIVMASSVNVLSVILSEQLLNKIDYSNYLEYEITRLKGRRSRNDQGHFVIDDANSVSASDSNLIASDSMIDSQGKRKEIKKMVEHFKKEKSRPLLLGNPKLKDIRKALNENGISAEFLSGDLLCSGESIRLKKLPDINTFMMEGMVSADYYKIRQNLYSNLGII